MKTRPLGKGGPELTSVGFGAWAIGGPWRFGWVLHHPAVTSAIVGARTALQAEENAGAADVDLTPEDLVAIERLLAESFSPSTM